MKKIVSIVGARPQFIKHAPMELALKRYYNSISIHTGQHFDANMSAVFFNELKIDKPGYVFDLGDSRTHAKITGKMMVLIEEILIKERPNAVLVYGDTNSTLAGAIVASKLNIPVIHIEAGLRSFNKEMPEEVNRILTDHVSSLLFTPTRNGLENLAKEGIETDVYLTGDVMMDSVQMMLPYLRPEESGPYYFATIHRPYNTDNKERLVRILDAFDALDKPVVFSVHPRTSRNLRLWGIDLAKFNNVRFIDPIGYRESLSLQKYSSCVITDSGGMQKEAYMLRRKCITIRKETEWLETLTNGCNQLVFEDLGSLANVIHSPAGDFLDLYGVGNAAEEISAIISKVI